MDKRFFVPGHRLGLSIAEVVNHLSVHKAEFDLTTINDDFFIIESDFKKCNIERLGGIVKSGKILEVFDIKDFSQDILISTLIKSIVKNKKDKLSVILNFRGNVRNLRISKKNVLMGLKQTLRAEGIALRFPGDMNSLVSSAVVFDKKIKGKGLEFEVLADSTYVYIGSTDWVQDYEEFRERDYDKPFFDKEAGMLPPKLARIMVNLADTGKTKVVWDPFCGSGAVLMEALDLGYHLIGTDISDRAIKNTKGNIDWLMNRLDESGHYAGDKSGQFVFLKQNVIVGIHKVYKELGIEINSNIAFVTEPYLGPPVLRVLETEKAAKIIKNVHNIYIDFLNKVEYIDRQLGKPIDSIVMVVPEYKTRLGWIPLHLSKELKMLGRIGFSSPRWFSYLSKKIPNFDMYWFREESLIRRKILVLHKER
ncbi:DNA adenine methylase [Candidatus Dojkabacteria bacterium]|nr:DNA adenine methylase [Candidatus Dojkabacteria bacterium]